MRNILIAIAIAAALTGCKTTEQLQAEDHSVCEQLGPQGSQNYADCRMLRMAQREQGRQAALERVQEDLQNLQRINERRYYTLPRPGVTCTEMRGLNRNAPSQIQCW